MIHRLNYQKSIKNFCERSAQIYCKIKVTWYNKKDFNWILPKDENEYRYMTMFTS